MHELSIAYSLVESVAESAAAHGGGRVLLVRIQVGALSGVVSEALRFSYDIATEGTVLAGSTLEIESIPISIWCEPCAGERQLANSFRFACPDCGAPSADIRRGRELDIVHFELEASAAASSSAMETA